MYTFSFSLYCYFQRFPLVGDNNCDRNRKVNGFSFHSSNRLSLVRLQMSQSGTGTHYKHLQPAWKKKKHQINHPLNKHGKTHPSASQFVHQIKLRSHQSQNRRPSCQPRGLQYCIANYQAKKLH